MYECVMGMAKHEGNGTVRKYENSVTFADTHLERVHSCRCNGSRKDFAGGSEYE